MGNKATTPSQDPTLHQFAERLVLDLIARLLGLENDCYFRPSLARNSREDAPAHRVPPAKRWNFGSSMPIKQRRDRRYLALDTAPKAIQANTQPVQIRVGSRQPCRLVKLDTMVGRFTKLRGGRSEMIR